MSKIYFLIAFLIWSILGTAQSSKELLAFKQNAIANANSSDSLLPFDGQLRPGKINYLSRLAKVYSNDKGNMNFDALSQMISFLGDYRSVLECLQLSHHSVDERTENFLEKMLDSHKGAYLADAKKTILQMSKSKSVVMINEAHCKPIHRAFVYSLLKEFYVLGFKYLAMETLNNLEDKELQKLTVNSGFYTCEPVGGELVRKALRIGFKLIPYEDTSKSSSSFQRDSAQAMHLYEIIKKTPSAKILVLAGYGHIEKTKGRGDFTPMGYQFKRISNIEPLSIDQTFLTEEGNDGFSSLLYSVIQRKYPVITASVLFKNDKPIVLLGDSGLYDLRIIHPPSTYYKGRAAWYSLNNERKPQNIRVPTSNCFLMQAYYIDEWNQSQCDSIVPADQTYIKYNDKSSVLFLRAGTYKIAFRDMNYKIVKSKILVIK